MFWLDAKSVATAEQGFNAIGTLCGVAESSIENVKLRLGSHSERCLLINDNTDNPKTDYVNYIPSGKRGDIWFTTRIPECVIYGTVGNQMLDGLAPKPARSLLLRAAQIPENRWKDMTHAAIAVVDAVVSHTLAIVQAGAYIRSNLCTIEGYPVLFQEQKQRLIEFHSDQVLSTYGNVYATFEISAEFLQKSRSQNDLDALELLHIVAFLHDHEISEEMFDTASGSALDTLETGLMNGRIFSRNHILRLPEYLQRKWSSPGGRTRWRNARSILASLSIVKIGESRAFGTMSLHSSLHTWAKERQDRYTRCEAWQSAATILALWGCTFHMSRFFGSPLIPHMGACSSHEFEDYMEGRSDLETAKILFQPAEMYKSCRWNNRLLNSLIPRISSRLMRSDQTGKQFELKIKQYTASVYFVQANFKKAVRTLEDIADKQIRAAGDDDPLVIALHDELFHAYIEVGQDSNAIQLIEKVVNVRQKLPKDGLEPEY